MSNGLKRKIFFDLDGTLVDVSRRHYQVYVQIVKELDGRALNQKNYWEMKLAGTDWSIILKKSRLTEEQTNKFLKKFVESIEKDENLKLDRVFPKTRQTLRALRSNHILLLVSLRSRKRVALKQLKNLKLVDYFQAIKIGRTQKVAYRDKKDFILEIGFRLGDLVVGDSETEIQTARVLGLPVVAVYSGLRNQKFLRKLKPNALIKNVTFLPALLSADSGWPT